MRISDWSSDVCSSDLDPIDEDVDGLPAGAPVVGGQRADAAAVEGNPWAQPGDQEKDDVTDAGRAQRPGRPDVQDVDVALGQDAGERARPGGCGGIAGDAQAGREINQEERDDDPVEPRCRDVSSQPLTQGRSEER